MFEKRCRRSCEVNEGKTKKIIRSQTLNENVDIRHPSIYMNIAPDRSPYFNDNRLETYENLNSQKSSVKHHQINGAFLVDHNFLNDHNKNGDLDESVGAVREQFTTAQLMTIFNILSNNHAYLFPDDLVEALEEINEGGFKRYEMVRLLDKNNKGYISLDQFIQYFENGLITENKLVLRIPANFIQEARWKETIDQNYQILSALTDVQFCHYIKKRVTEN